MRTIPLGEGVIPGPFQLDGPREEHIVLQMDVLVRNALKRLEAAQPPAAAQTTPPPRP